MDTTTASKRRIIRMEDRTKRKREEEGPQGSIKMGNKDSDNRFALLISEFEESVKGKSIKDKGKSIKEAIVESVIKEEKDHYTKIFNEMENEPHGEDSSDESDPYMGSPKAELEKRKRGVGIQREGLLHMLNNQQIYMVGSEVHSPLEKGLPDDISRWMHHHEMGKSSFEPSKHRDSGFRGSHGFLEHLKRKQQNCLYHRALLLWYYVHGGEGAMVWNETCNGYRHNCEEVQDRINKSKVRHAPSCNNKYLILQFQWMITGKEEWKKQSDLGRKVKKNIDWDFVMELHMMNHYLQNKERHDMKNTADLLRATVKEMEEERKEHQNATTKWVIHVVSRVLAAKNIGDYTSLGSMMKGLAETYSTLSEEFVSLTEERCDELNIPSYETKPFKDSFKEERTRNLYCIQLDVVLGNKYQSMDIINEIYKTQKKAPGSLPSGVPTGRGRP